MHQNILCFFCISYLLSSAFFLPVSCGLVCNKLNQNFGNIMCSQRTKDLPVSAQIYKRDLLSSTVPFTRFAVIKIIATYIHYDFYFYCFVQIMVCGFFISLGTFSFQSGVLVFPCCVSHPCRQMFPKGDLHSVHLGIFNSLPFSQCASSVRAETSSFISLEFYSLALCLAQERCSPNIY